MKPWLLPQLALVAGTVASADAECDETMHGTSGSGYRGCQTRQTRSGRTCQKWTVNSPHDVDPNLSFEGTGLGDNNYCRNPD